MPVRAEDRPILYLLLLVVGIVLLIELWQAIRIRFLPGVEKVPHLTSLVDRGFRILIPASRAEITITRGLENEQKLGEGRLFFSLVERDGERFVVLRLKDWGFLEEGSRAVRERLLPLQLLGHADGVILLSPEDEREEAIRFTIQGLNVPGRRRWQPLFWAFILGLLVGIFI